MGLRLKFRRPGCHCFVMTVCNDMLLCSVSGRSCLGPPVALGIARDLQLRAGALATRGGCRRNSAAPSVLAQLQNLS